MKSIACTHTNSAESYLSTSSSSRTTLYHSWLNLKATPSRGSPFLWRENVDEKLLENWQVRWRISPPTTLPSCIFMMEVDSAGRTLAFSRESTEVEFWDVMERKHVKSIAAHDDVVTALAFFKGNPESYFTASLDKTICCWKNHKKITKLHQHNDWLRCLSLSEHNSLLLSGYILCYYKDGNNKIDVFLQ